MAKHFGIKLPKIIGGNIRFGINPRVIDKHIEFISLSFDSLQRSGDRSLITYIKFNDAKFIALQSLQFRCFLWIAAGSENPHITLEIFFDECEANATICSRNQDVLHENSFNDQTNSFT